MNDIGQDPTMTKQSDIDNDPLNPKDMANVGRTRPVEHY